MSDIRLKIKEEVLKFRKEILSEEMVQSEAYKALKNTLKTLKKKNKVLLLTCSNRFNWDEENIDIPKSTIIGSYLEEELGDKAVLIDVPELKFDSCSVRYTRPAKFPMSLCIHPKSAS